MVVRTVQSIPLGSQSVPEGLVLYEQVDTTAHIEGKNLGVGKLYVSESKLVWIHSTSGQGFSIDYPRITIHAISRDTTNFPEECIYLQVEKENAEEGGGDNMEGDDEDEEDTGMIEVQLVPQDKTSLEDVFGAMNQAQKMNPDPNDSPLSDDDDDENDDDEDDGHFEDLLHEGNGHGHIPNGYGGQGSSEDEGMELDDRDR